MFEILVTLCVLLTPTIFAESASHANCVFGPNEVTGTLQLSQTDDGSMAITGKMYGLKPGKHGFHAHMSGDIATGCNAAGAHFNPDNKMHGAQDQDDRHAGDFGNVLADENGVADVNIVDDQLSFEGKYNVMGRSIVVHAQEDDLGLTDHPDSKTTGNSGGRLACCTIVAA